METPPKPLLLEEFSRFLQTEKGASPHTVLAYCTDVEALGRFIHAEYGLDILARPEDLPSVHHRMVRAWMGSQDVARSTQQRKMASVRRFFRFQLTNGRIQNNPVTKLVNPKQGKRIPTFVPKDDLIKSLDALPDQAPRTTDFVHVRNVAVIEMLYSAGLRRAELIGLRFQDVDLQGRYIRVMGKGRKERRVPFGVPAQKALKEYIQAAGALGLDLYPALFVREDGKPLYPKLVYIIVNQFLSQIPGLAKASPHVLRHSFATHLVDAKAELQAVQQLLGHTRLSTTRLYVHAAAERLKAVHVQAHPHGE